MNQFVVQPEEEVVGLRIRHREWSAGRELEAVATTTLVMQWT